MLASKRGFTLIEMIVSIAAFSVLLAIIFVVLQQMIRIKTNIQARQAVLQGAQYTMEKIHTYIQDYTIDYEEYRNRYRIGCDTIGDMSAGDNGYCDIPSGLGNTNNVSFQIQQHRLYYCSARDNQSMPQLVIQSPNVSNGAGCVQAGPQSFGQYAKQFIDVWWDVDEQYGIVGDSDDRMLGRGPQAIQDSIVPELYLISPDQTKRIYIRRVLLGSGDRNDDGILSWYTEKHYALQILRLQWFDAGQNHDFDTSNPWVNDGQIDTRVCDAAQWFFCQWQAMPGIYSGYAMPADIYDGRVTFTQDDISISDWMVSITPYTDIQYAFDDVSAQINPAINIGIVAHLNGEKRQSKLNQSTDINDFTIDIQTTFSTKTRYTK